jgi:hypothetical protein
MENKTDGNQSNDAMLRTTLELKAIEWGKIIILIMHGGRGFFYKNTHLQITNQLAHK